MNKTIMVSWHILPELADICNKIGIIERGKLIFNGDVEAAIQQVAARRVFTRLRRRAQRRGRARRLRAYPEVESVEARPEDRARSTCASKTAAKTAASSPSA